VVAVSGINGRGDYGVPSTPSNAGPPKQTFGEQIISNIRYLINDRVKLSFVLLTLYVYISPVSRFGGGYAGFGDLAIHRCTFWLSVNDLA